MTPAKARPGRRIPDSWFHASPMSTTMAFVRPEGYKMRERKLAPGERQLGWFVLPPFQRPPVWTEAQQIRFIESAWMGLPLGVFIWNEAPRMDGPYDRWLLDGQQRIGAVLSYMEDGFRVFGHLFGELGEVDYRLWDMATAFPCLKTNLSKLSELEEVYDRLAYGGTPHEPKP